MHNFAIVIFSNTVIYVLHSASEKEINFNDAQTHEKEILGGTRSANE